MAGLDLTRGLRAPLFDMLIEPAPSELMGAGSPEFEREPVRMLDREGLRDSVQREVSRLLNTRTSHSVEELVGRERTILEYGLPDLSHFYGGSREDHLVLIDEIRSAIQAFEPRLADVQVEVGMFDQRQRHLSVAIGGDIRVDGLIEPVEFAVLIGESGDGRHREVAGGIVGT